MADFPTGLMQQMHAKPVSGEHLELLGKQAADKWCSGECGTVADAVVETVKQASLSPEQVKRVCEFANTAAYLREFKKEGSHKFIDFGSAGPANPSDVLKDLNDGGGGSVYDKGTFDYGSPPPNVKLSSHVAETKLQEYFPTKEAPLLQHNPYEEVMSLRDKLASAYDAIGSEVETLELQYADIADRLYGDVKQAALSGVSLDNVLRAWTDVAPTADFAKVAFQLFTPRLLREGVFTTVDALKDSLTKTASIPSNHVVNEAHPLVLGFGEFCVTLQKLAEFRVSKKEVGVHVENLTDFLKTAGAAETAGGAVRGLWDKSVAGSAWAGKQVGDFARNAKIPGAGVAEWGVAHAPHAAAILAANEARLRLENNPIAQDVKSVIPGTREYNYKKIMMQQGQY